jgi:hypothetical protein
MKTKTSSKPAARNPIAVLAFQRFGRTTKVMHDRRRPRDRNRSQTEGRAVKEY